MYVANKITLEPLNLWLTFSQRMVPIWNELPEEVVVASTTTALKQHLDGSWIGKEHGSNMDKWASWWASWSAWTVWAKRSISKPYKTTIPWVYSQVQQPFRLNLSWISKDIWENDTSTIFWKISGKEMNVIILQFMLNTIFCNLVRFIFFPSVKKHETHQ